MSALEVLQSCPKQWKALLYALGAVDLADTRMMAFDLDKATPRLPPWSPSRYQYQYRISLFTDVP